MQRHTFPNKNPKRKRKTKQKRRNQTKTFFGFKKSAERKTMEAKQGSAEEENETGTDADTAEEDDDQEAMKKIAEKSKEMAQSARVPVPHTSVPLVGHVDSLALKQLICGAIAGGFSGVAAAPFEFLRSKVVAGKGGGSVTEVFGDTLRREGIEFVKKGSLVSCVLRTAFQRGILFCTYEAVKRREEKRFGEDLRWFPGLPKEVSVSTVAGAVAAFTSTVVTYPLSTIGDRMFLKGNKYKSLSNAAKQIVKKEGVKELYRGLLPKLIGMIPEGAASFYTYEAMKRRYMDRRRLQNEDEVGPAASALFGAVAGLVSTTVTYPLDNVRTMMSMKGLPKGSRALASSGDVTNTFYRIVKSKGFGLGGLYRGVGLRYAEIIPVTALSFAVYELAKRILIARHREKPHEVKG